MKLTWFGTAALLLSDGTSVIAFDPFLGIPAGYADAETHPVCVFTDGNADKQQYTSQCVRMLREASDVFVTHGHFDHILQIPALYRGTQASVHATATPCDTMRRHGLPEDMLRLIKPGQNVRTGDFSVTAYRSRHCRFDAPLVMRTAFRRETIDNLGHLIWMNGLRRDFPENRETLFYEVVSGNTRVQIMGSLGLDPSTEYPTGADALILPYQGRSKPAEYALPLIERLQPRSVLLDHYDNSFSPLTSPVDTSDIISELPRLYGIPCRALRHGETIHIGENII